MWEYTLTKELFQNIFESHIAHSINFVQMKKRK